MAVTLSDLDVADVSGMIAAAVALIQIFVPLALSIILVGVLKEGQARATTTSAVSWSVIGRFLHASRWPTLLAADSVSIRGVPLPIVLLTRLKAILVFLAAIAAVVTPLGLYQTIVEGEWTENVPFHYIRDQSEFGLGTPPRVDLRWNRYCGDVLAVECPNSFGNITTLSDEDTGLYENSYDPYVPEYVIDVFQSGLENMEDSVSSMFDIQSRSYSWELINDIPGDAEPDYKRPHPVDSFRMISSNILADDYLAVEGLVVDMKNGGIGFRNHSAPPRTPYGSTWSEDLLFIEPESVCVDTNLTLDFGIYKYMNEAGIFFYRFTEDLNSTVLSRLVLTDQGGFVNLNLSYPVTNDLHSTQREPQLWARAYRGAWMNNLLTMVFLNVTNLKIKRDTDSRPFTYLRSHLGKQFQLNHRNGGLLNFPKVSPDRFSASFLYGNYLTASGLPNDVGLFNSTLVNYTIDGETSKSGAIVNITVLNEESLYENPFNVTLTDFLSANDLCSGVARMDAANIDSFDVACGLVFGTPRRTDGDKSSTSVFDPGSNWSIPLYSCAMTTKATIKNVAFRFNGTDDLSAIKVTGIQNKIYPNDDSKPLWGVERTDKRVGEVPRLWGLISDSDKGNVSVHTLRQESLYLPGRGSSPLHYETLLLSSNRGNQYLPGAEFYTKALASVFDMGMDIPFGSGLPDYTGRTSLAMYRRWHELSRTAATTPKILNLIWTDIASNAVVGTRGWHGARTQSSSMLTKRDNVMSKQASNAPAVKYMQSRVRYRWAYAIPAFVVLFFAAGIVFATMVFALMGRVSTSRMRQYLNLTSQGRIATTYLYGQNGEMPAPPTSHMRTRSSTRRWVENMGKSPVTVAEGENDFLAIDDPRRPQVILAAGESESTEGSHCDPGQGNNGS